MARVSPGSRESRGNRRAKCFTAVAMVLMCPGVPVTAWAIIRALRSKMPALRSPAQVEKMRAVGKSTVAGLCHKPPGGLTVAPESDPRSEVDPTQELAAGAAADFAEGDDAAE